jgi:ABC-2 type transport system permease protein
MSASATAASASAVAPIATEARPGLARLTVVELRKMTDTRAGFWLLAAVAALTVAIVTIAAVTGSDARHTLREMLSAAVAPSSVLLPIVGILLVSSEWSQRTAQITFTLVPQRPRVIGAKLLAGAALTLTALVVCLPVAALGTALTAPEVDHAWSLPAGLLFQHAVALITGMVGGIAFGAVLLASAPAIVLFFALPITLSALGSLPPFEGAARWLDGTRSLAPLSEHLMSGTEWARALTTLAVWMLLPLLIGIWRINRDEVK